MPLPQTADKPMAQVHGVYKYIFLKIQFSIDALFVKV